MELNLWHFIVIIIIVLLLCFLYTLLMYIVGKHYEDKTSKRNIEFLNKVSKYLFSHITSSSDSAHEISSQMSNQANKIQSNKIHSTDTSKIKSSNAYDNGTTRRRDITKKRSEDKYRCESTNRHLKDRRRKPYTGAARPRQNLGNSKTGRFYGSETEKSSMLITNSSEIGAYGGEIPYIYSHGSTHADVSKTSEFLANENNLEPSDISISKSTGDMNEERLETHSYDWRNGAGTISPKLACASKRNDEHLTLCPRGTESRRKDSVPQYTSRSALSYNGDLNVLGSKVVHGFERLIVSERRNKDSKRSLRRIASEGDYEGMCKYESYTASERRSDSLQRCEICAKNEKSNGSLQRSKSHSPIKSNDKSLQRSKLAPKSERSHASLQRPESYAESESYDASLGQLQIHIPYKTNNTKYDSGYMLENKRQGSSLVQPEIFSKTENSGEIPIPYLNVPEVLASSKRKTQNSGLKEMGNSFIYQELKVEKPAMSDRLSTDINLSNHSDINPIPVTTQTLNSNVTTTLEEEETLNSDVRTASQETETLSNSMGTTLTTTELPNSILNTTPQMADAQNTNMNLMPENGKIEKAETESTRRHAIVDKSDCQQEHPHNKQHNPWKQKQKRKKRRRKKKPFNVVELSTLYVVEAAEKTLYQTKNSEEFLVTSQATPEVTSQNSFLVVTQATRALTSQDPTLIMSQATSAVTSQTPSLATSQFTSAITSQDSSLATSQVTSEVTPQAPYLVMSKLMSHAPSLITSQITSNVMSQTASPIESQASGTRPKTRIGTTHTCKIQFSELSNDSSGSSEEITPDEKELLDNSNRFLRQEQHGQHSTDKYYIKQDNPGMVLIINNIQFGDLRERAGASKDKDLLIGMFEKKKWHPTVYKENLCASDMKTAICDFIQKGEESRPSCVAVFILTHGELGFPYGSDGGKVNISKDVFQPFDEQHCQCFVGIPKLFFIQACQIEAIERTVLTQRLNAGASGYEPSTFISPNQCAQVQTDADEEDPKIIYLEPKDPKNMFIAFSCRQGEKSLRDPNNGSIFIQQVVANLCKEERVEIYQAGLQIIEQVKRIANRYNHTQIPAIKFYLDKTLYI